jgi:hypothetical protein
LRFDSHGGEGKKNLWQYLQGSQIQQHLHQSSKVSNRKLYVVICEQNCNFPHAYRYWSLVGHPLLQLRPTSHLHMCRHALHCSSSVYFEGCRMMFGKESSANFSRHDKKKRALKFSKVQ